MTRRNENTNSAPFDPPVHSKRSRDYLTAILDMLGMPYPKNLNRDKLVDLIKTALADREAELSVSPRFKGLYQGGDASGVHATTAKVNTSAAKAAHDAAQAALDNDATATGVHRTLIEKNISIAPPPGPRPAGKQTLVPNAADMNNCSSNDDNDSSTDGTDTANTDEQLDNEEVTLVEALDIGDEDVDDFPSLIIINFLDPSVESAYAKQVVRVPVTIRGGGGIKIERKHSAKYDRPVWQSDLSKTLLKGLEDLSPKKPAGGKWSLVLEDGGSENLGTEAAIRERLGPLAYDGLNQHEFPHLENDKTLQVNVLFRPGVAPLAEPEGPTDTMVAVMPVPATGSRNLTTDEAFHAKLAHHFGFKVERTLAVNSRIALDRWKKRKSFIDDVTTRPGWQRPGQQGLRVPSLGEDTIPGYEGCEFGKATLLKMMHVSSGIDTRDRRLFDFDRDEFSEQLSDIIAWIDNPDDPTDKNFNKFSVAALVRYTEGKKNGEAVESSGDDNDDESCSEEQPPKQKKKRSGKGKELAKKKPRRV